ncbi:MAG: FtsX-like permease family protein [Actinobacteria bacterium]|nr:FtsX-like permease family protein [Actinomycetota bacterium]
MSFVSMQATARLAWRSARRNMGRSLLIVSMIALPVMLVVAAGATARTSLSTPTEVASWEAMSFVAGALALFATGLIAGAAIVVGARRQLRELGLVSAIGGERRHVLATVVLGGTALGIVGSLGGAILGAAGAYLAHPFMDDLVGHPVGPVELNLLAVIGAMAMGTAAATLAALAPARSAAMISILDALAGRTGQPRRPGRVAWFGLLVVVAGGVLTVVGTQTDDDIFQAGGFIAMLSGFLCSIPLLVTSLGQVASRLPMTGRLAARDAARHGRRTGAAVAAAVIALSIPVAASTYSLSRETLERRSASADDDQALSQYRLARTATTAGSVPVALAILGVAVALVASESRRSRQILVAIGAAPMSHRKLLGMTSALLALVAGVLAVPAGLGPMVALWASQPPGPDRLPFVVPWATIGFIIFAVPCIAGFVSGLVARPPPLRSLLRPAA